jgi:hypothetical protein
MDENRIVRRKGTVDVEFRHHKRVVIRSERSQSDNVRTSREYQVGSRCVCVNRAKVKAEDFSS